MKPVRFHPAIDAKVQAAARFYENRQTGLGNELLEVVEQTMREVQQAPTRCQLVEGTVRKRRLARFPYALVFEDREDCIQVIALMHFRQRPRYWKSCLSPNE